MWIIWAYLAVSFLAAGVYRLREVGDLVGDAATRGQLIGVQCLILGVVFLALFLRGWVGHVKSVKKPW